MSHPSYALLHLSHSLSSVNIRQRNTYIHIKRKGEAGGVGNYDNNTITKYSGLIGFWKRLYQNARTPIFSNAKFLGTKKYI